MGQPPAESSIFTLVMLYGGRLPEISYTFGLAKQSHRVRRLCRLLQREVGAMCRDLYQQRPVNQTETQASVRVSETD